METHSVETQISQKKSYTKRIITSCHEDYGGLSFKFIEKISKIAILPLGWDEQILLYKGLCEKGLGQGAMLVKFEYC